MEGGSEARGYDFPPLPALAMHIEWNRELDSKLLGPVKIYDLTVNDTTWLCSLIPEKL